MNCSIDECTAYAICRVGLRCAPCDITQNEALCAPHYAVFTEGFPVECADCHTPLLLSEPVAL